MIFEMKNTRYVSTDENKKASNALAFSVSISCKSNYFMNLVLMIWLPSISSTK